MKRNTIIIENNNLVTDRSFTCRVENGVLRIIIEPDAYNIKIGGGKSVRVEWDDRNAKVWFNYPNPKTTVTSLPTTIVATTTTGIAPGTGTTVKVYKK